MIPINIFILTRVSESNLIQKMERQMSKRKKPLHVKEWEVEGLCRLSNHLHEILPEFSGMKFFYSFMIPRIGKEFDLLQISDDYVINIELKSEDVTEDLMKRQLLQNRYYLSSLKRTVRSYTYVSKTDKLYRLSNGENLVESKWDKLCDDLKKMSDCYEEDLEELFLESQFLISPLTDSDKFLNREYFLTFQQRDIRSQILQNILQNKVRLQCFSGLPGTGKTLLLYDIAMSLSVKQRVCVLHFGFFPEGLKHLNERLRRIDFFACRNMDALPDMDSYDFILVDEGHQMREEVLLQLLEYSRKEQKPVLFAYDMEEAISNEEVPLYLHTRMLEMPEVIRFQLTNRIRMNKELSIFIHSLMCPVRYYHRREYPSVFAAYANDAAELGVILRGFINQGYVYIEDASDTTSKEFDKVIMVVDERFYYDDAGYLRTRKEEDHSLGVRNLFHGLNRAKKSIAIVCMNNKTIFSSLLSMIQS